MAERVRVRADCVEGALLQDDRAGGRSHRRRRLRSAKCGEARSARSASSSPAPWSVIASIPPALWRGNLDPNPRQAGWHSRHRWRVRDDREEEELQEPFAEPPGNLLGRDGFRPRRGVDRGMRRPRRRRADFPTPCGLAGECIATCRRTRRLGHPRMNGICVRFRASEPELAPRRQPQAPRVLPHARMGRSSAPDQRAVESPLPFRPAIGGGILHRKVIPVRAAPSMAACNVRPPLWFLTRRHP